MQVTLPNEILLAEVGAMLSEGKDVVLMTKGWSMNPTIVGERDSVLLRKTGSPQVGDIVLARLSPKHYVLHRIVAIDAGKVTLMGDGNLTGQEHCTAGDILGTVQRVLPPRGKGFVPGKASLWRKTGPLTRRIVLGIYRRSILKILMLGAKDRKQSHI